MIDFSSTIVASKEEPYEPTLDEIRPVIAQYLNELKTIEAHYNTSLPQCSPDKPELKEIVTKIYKGLQYLSKGSQAQRSETTKLSMTCENARSKLIDKYADQLDLSYLLTLASNDMSQARSAHLVYSSQAKFLDQFSLSEAELAREVSARQWLGRHFKEKLKSFQYSDELLMEQVDTIKETLTGLSDTHELVTRWKDYKAATDKALKEEGWGDYLSLTYRDFREKQILSV